jgi:hypothetical protein
VCSPFQSDSCKSQNPAMDIVQVSWPTGWHGLPLKRQALSTQALHVNMQFLSPRFSRYQIKIKDDSQGWTSVPWTVNRPMVLAKHSVGVRCERGVV